MTCHYPNLGSASDCSCHVGNLIQPIRSTSQIWVVMHHQYGISALVSLTSFGGETSGSITKCWLFSQARVGGLGGGGGVGVWAKGWGFDKNYIILVHFPRVAKDAFII